MILHPHAGADWITIPEDIVHAAYVRPEFVFQQALGRERRRFAGVGTIPRIVGDLVRRVRGVQGV